MVSVVRNNKGGEERDQNGRIWEGGRREDREGKAEERRG